MGASVPATAAVVIPENHLKLHREIVFIFTMVGVMCFTLFLGPNINADVKLPYMKWPVSANALGAAAGALLIMSVAAAIRLFRDRQGKDGAAMLFAGIVVAMLAEMFWIWAGSMCRRTDLGKTWLQLCLLNEGVNHNSIVILCLLLSNFLAAEGVIRLMAAGSGIYFYAEIPLYTDHTIPVTPSVERIYCSYPVQHDYEDPYRTPPYPPYSKVLEAVSE